jgi:hypothetical protein
VTGGADFLFETDFVNSQLVWPRAQPGFAALAKASQQLQEEIERDKKVVLKIPMKRMATMDKQLNMAETLLTDMLHMAHNREAAARRKAELASLQAQQTLAAATDMIQTI